MRKALIFTGGVAVAILLGFILGRFTAEKGRRDAPTVQIDTLYIYDTVTVTEPVYVEKKMVKRELVEVVDTLRLRDTLFVYLDREQVEWRDSLCTIWASGILPAVDSVRHYQKHTFITKEITKVVPSNAHWGVGVQAGYGVTVAENKVKGVPYIGVGISWNFFTW